MPAGIHLTSFLQSIGGQAGYVLPWIWVPLVWLLVRALVAGPGDPKRWLLCCLALGPIVVFTLPSLGGSPGLPHWEAPGYLFLFPLLGEAVDRWLRERRRGARGWLGFSVAGFLVLLAVLSTHIATGWIGRAAPSLFRRGDPSWEAMDWRELAPALKERGLLSDSTRSLAAPSWIEAGKTAYAMGPHVPTVCLCSSPHQFGLLDPQTSFLGRDAVIVERTPTGAGSADPAARFAEHFRSVEPEGQVTMTRMGHAEFSLTIFLARGFERPWGRNERHR